MTTTAVIVHYGTPDLTRAAAWSLRTHYPELPILVVDNGPREASGDGLATLASEAGGITVLPQESNLHHGPGMDAGIRHAATTWALTFDSDCFAYRAGFLEAMLAVASGGTYMVGQMHTVDEKGFDVAAGDDGAHPYVHPKCALVRREHYMQLPPFERHGAPCLTNEREAVRRGLQLEAFPVRDYVLHLGEGTVRRYGYGLGARGRLARVRRLLRGA